MILVSVHGAAPGWVDLHFRYAPEVITYLKMIPGLRWQKEKRSWGAPLHALPALRTLEAANLVKFTQGPNMPVEPSVAPHPAFMGNLRPYQQEGVARLLANRNYILAFSPRVGKTRTAAAAAGSLLADGRIRTVALLYPNVAKYEWVTQFKDQVGLEVLPFEGTTEFAPAEFNRLAALPHLCVGIHYELIREKGDDQGRGAEFLRLLEARGDFVAIGDEIHTIKNRKAGRTKWALGLSRSPKCRYRFALTGTPMRNYPRDMWAMFDWTLPDSMSSYSRFSVRYCGGAMGDYGWVDDGVTHHEELAERLSAFSFRLTRRDVAQYLPASDRSVVLCNMTKAELARYQKQEAALGPKALAAMNEGNSTQSVAALQQLAALTTATKISTLLDRLYEHVENRKVKVLVFANFHETLSTAYDAWEAESASAPTPKAHPRFSAPGFLVGGWMQSEKRRKAIAQWKACPGPAILFANILSSGVGIDLADADTAIFVELAWVPADFMQAEARIQDVHQGKRTTPPLYEYLLVRGTVDEDMGLKLIEKVRGIEKVVGGDTETKGLSGALEASGLVDRNVLSLANEDESTVVAALDRLRTRLFGDEVPDADPDSPMSDRNDTQDDEDEDGDNAGDDSLSEE